MNASTDNIQCTFSLTPPNVYYVHTLKTSQYFRLSLAFTHSNHFYHFISHPGTQAMPSFARQTGASCSQCHTQSFGPNLTPYGRDFKLGGYTMGEGTGFPKLPPISAIITGSFTNTNKDQPNVERTSLQYIGYSQANGISTAAQDNNIFILNGWLAF